jgi:tetratricopeptide (TPR) repeat protein
MKIKLALLIVLILAYSTLAQSLILDIKGELRDDSLTGKPIWHQVFHNKMLLPVDQNKEIFAGPYTVKLSAKTDSVNSYALTTEFIGLTPDYHNTQYQMKLTPDDPMVFPLLPVKGNISIRYTLTLLDNEAQLSSPEPDINDTLAWGTTESIHYRTHWLRGSLADFMWNDRMGFLEQIYDRYRFSFSLSSFDKIDLYFYPKSDSVLFVNPQLNYLVQPKAMRIDLIFGQGIDAASPRPGAEILLYKLWGYGPRWLVTGFAGYYFDNILRMRALAEKILPEELAVRFADPDWIDSDTGRIVTGAFVHWLADNNHISKFMDLYRQATDIDFEKKYKEIYGQDFTQASSDFLKFVQKYVPNEGELGFYSSVYLQQGNLPQAEKYLKELVDSGNKDSGPARKTLAMCQFWQGDYDAASKTLGPVSQTPTCDSDIVKTNYIVANGLKNPIDAFSIYAGDIHCGQAMLALGAAYLDRGKIDKAGKFLDSLNTNIAGSPEYLIELGRLNVIRRQPVGDSILIAAAAIVLNRAQTQPSEPANYLMAGQAFMLMGQFDKAKNNLETSLFLEKRPYFVGCILLELGKLADLQDKHVDAKEYYAQVLNNKSGAYQKSLAKMYREKKFTLKP